MKRSIFGIYYQISCATILYLTIGLDFAFAQSSLTPPTPEICDVNLSLLKSSDLSKNPNIVTADTVSPEGKTIPSLWWTNEQFPARLVTNWIADRSQKQIFLLVDTQYWNILDYLDRYRTIDKFGRVAQSYGYDLKICSIQKIVLANYSCELSVSTRTVQNTDNAATQNICQIWLNSNGQNGLSVQNK
jgi:hypothetical protein